MENLVLIIEDHPLYRHALIEVVRDIAGNSTPIAVCSAEEGLRKAGTLSHLKMILLDLELPGMSGIEALRHFIRDFPEVPVVVLSASDDRKIADAALRAGARFFLSKSASIELISDIAKRILSGISEAPQWVTTQADLSSSVNGDTCLTQRQRQTLTLLSNGYSNKEIGLRMGLAEITIKMHVSAIFRQLGVANRIQAVLAARRLGIEAALPMPAESEPK
jgi:DNA-binding NarL/FixJ family response regulator